MSTIRFLRTFLAVEKYGSFAAAAARVALTQAAVGQQMRALEEEFRRPLFSRSGRVITLTPAARALIPQARKLVAAYEAMLADADTGHEIAGSITVGAIVSAMGFLSENVVSLKAQYPALDVRLVLGHSGELADQVTASIVRRNYLEIKGKHHIRRSDSELKIPYNTGYKPSIRRRQWTGEPLL